MVQARVLAHDRCDVAWRSWIETRENAWVIEEREKAQSKEERVS